MKRAWSAPGRPDAEMPGRERKKEIEEFSIGATGTIQAEMIGSEVYGADANGTVPIVEDAMLKAYRPVIRPEPGEPARASSTPL